MVHNADKNVVTFGKYTGDWINRLVPVLETIHSLEISDSTMDRIKLILRENRLYEIKELEHPDVLDGYIQKFYLCDGERYVELWGHNMGCCRDKPNEYPNTAGLIDVLEEIGKLLIPEGVDKQCFMLTMQADGCEEKQNRKHRKQKRKKKEKIGFPR